MLYNILRRTELGGYVSTETGDDSDSVKETYEKAEAKKETRIILLFLIIVNTFVLTLCVAGQANGRGALLFAVTFNAFILLPILLKAIKKRRE